MLNNKIKVIAEIASAHGGDVDKLIDLIKISHDTGADFTKLQIFDSSSLLVEADIKQSDLYKIEIPMFQWKKILNFCEEIWPK